MCWDEWVRWFSCLYFMGLKLFIGMQLNKINRLSQALRHIFINLTSEYFKGFYFDILIYMYSGTFWNCSWVTSNPFGTLLKPYFVLFLLLLGRELLVNFFCDSNFLGSKLCDGLDRLVLKPNRD